MTTAMAGQQSAFEDDVNAYLAALPGLLNSSEGKFALIGDAKLVGVHSSHASAMQAGYDLFGLNGFLVQEISKFDLQMGQYWHSCQS